MKKVFMLILVSLLLISGVNAIIVDQFSNGLKQETFNLSQNNYTRYFNVDLDVNITNFQIALNSSYISKYTPTHDLTAALFYFDFEDSQNNGTYDRSNNSRGYSVNNITIEYYDEQRGNILRKYNNDNLSYFDINYSYETYNIAPIYDDGYNFSVSFIMNYTNIGGSNFQILTGFRGSGGAAYPQFYIYYLSTVGIAYRIADLSGQVDEWNCSGHVATLFDGNWHLLNVNWNKQVLEDVFIDGVNKTNECNHNLAQDATELNAHRFALDYYIGGVSGNPNRAVGNGFMLDNYVFYPFTLDNNDIQYMYNDGFLINPYINNQTLNTTLNIILANISLYNNLSKNKIYINTSQNISSLTYGCSCVGCNLTSQYCKVPITFYQSQLISTVYGINLEYGFTHTINLIDEVTGLEFNVTNLTSVLLYNDLSAIVFDFKANNTANYNLSGNNSEQLRIELTYEDGSVINRYIDTSLLTNPIRICANKEGVTHYAQYITSATQRKALLKSQYANCYVAADYVRFGYGEGLVLKAYTIDRPYVLTTSINDVDTDLAGLDGGISTDISLDVLIFRETAYNLDIVGDGIGINKFSDTTMYIYYNNIMEDNTDLSLTITNMNNSAVVYTKNDFLDKNSFSLYFDYSTLTGVSNQTLFKLELVKTKSTGETNTIKRYFNIAGSVGAIPSALGVIMAFVLTAFGLTISIPRYTFSWLGAIVVMASIGILGFTVSSWYVIFMATLDAIILIYIMVQLVIQYYPQVS